MWHASFLALSTVLGVPVPESEGAIVGWPDAEGRAVALALRANDRRQRALAMARPLALLVKAVDATRIG